MNKTISGCNAWHDPTSVLLFYGGRGRLAGGLRWLLCAAIGVAATAWVAALSEDQGSYVLLPEIL